MVTGVKSYNMFYAKRSTLFKSQILSKFHTSTTSKANV